MCQTSSSCKNVSIHYHFTCAAVMKIYVNIQGTPIQEFSAIYVNDQTFEIEDVFHKYVIYPCSVYDDDKWARKHVHGLDLDYLAMHGLRDEEELKTTFHTWLKEHPYDSIYGDHPSRESEFLSLPIMDVNLRSWSSRDSDLSHQIALFLKRRCARICNVCCAAAHGSFRYWMPVRVHNMSDADKARMKFRHHCAFYNVMECFLFQTKK